MRSQQDIEQRRERDERRKAELLGELQPLLMRVPPSIVNGSIQAVKHWQARRAAAAKLAANKAATVKQLEDAVADLKGGGR